MAEAALREKADLDDLSWVDQPGQPQHSASVDSLSHDPSLPSSLPSSAARPLSASAAASSDPSPSHSAHALSDAAAAPSRAAHSATNGHGADHVASAHSADTFHAADTVNGTTDSAQRSAVDASPAAGSSSALSSDAAAAASRKRHSRWGDNDIEPGAAAATSATSASAEPRKRSRWGDKDTFTAPASIITAAAATAAGATPAMAAALTAAAIAARLGQSSFAPANLDEVKLQLRIDELTRLMLNPLAHVASDEPRSPEPEPTYDNHGQRTNTREQRYRAKYTNERNELILQLTGLNPSYRPPSDWKRQTRFERRVYIPQKDYPDYNFIGLIIGPRGSTQKQMEKETGCKIVIRGKGSSKEGKGRTGGRAEESENDETHVLITGEDKAKVDSAATMVEKLMVPVDDATNEHKTKQLRELALINGTLRDDIVCRVCGQRGHKLFECPERTGAAWRPAEVKCEWCGETSHISTDCPRREEGKERREEWDAEYASFMNEITGGSLQDKGISGLIDDHKRGAATGSDGGGGRGREEGGRGGQLLLTDGVDRRPSNVLRVGDGIVRRIVTNDPRENAREYRPLNPPPSSQAPSSASSSQSAASGYIHPSRMHPSSFHAVPPPSSVARPPPPMPPPQQSYGAYPPPPYGYYPPPPSSYYHPQHHPPPPGAPAGYPTYYPPPHSVPPPIQQPAAAAAPPAVAALAQPPQPAAASLSAGAGGGAAAGSSTASSPSSATNGAERVNRYAVWPPPAISAAQSASGTTAASKPAGVNRYAQWPPPSV